jgi:hypothetical protein
MAERRIARVQQRVVHQHRIGAQVFKRVSEFVYVRGEPKAILRWIDVAGMRAPIYLHLDAAKLRRIRAGAATLFLYTGTTVDPASVHDARPPMRGRRRAEGAPIPGGRRRTDPPLGDAR